MIEIMPNTPGNVVGFVATGQVSAADYEQILIPAIKASLEKHNKVRVLYQLGNELTGFSAGAMWDDMKLGMGHLASWEKIAVVTDIGWVAHATRMFGFVLPCPVKVFSLHELNKAKEWVAA